MHNLLVEYCNVKSLATGLKLGTESTGPYRNITFRHSTIMPGTHRGMSLQVLARPPYSRMLRDVWLRK